MPQQLQRLPRLAAAALCAVLLAGCATMNKDPEVAVRERAQQRWAALIAEDFPKAYSYMPPSYRAATPFERFKATFKGALKWTKAEVVWVKCDTDDRCIARMKVDSQVLTMRGAPSISNAYEETWVREQDGWWLFPTP